MLGEKPPESRWKSEAELMHYFFKIAPDICNMFSFFVSVARVLTLDYKGREWLLFLAPVWTVPKTFINHQVKTGIPYIK